ncbi:hypothetical protein NCS52_00724900 [Fusarium sp. LHS14.1]|nr:hypothetical protein NCS52_00724900 [Fusarium sp. LHS14.1]
MSRQTNSDVDPPAGLVSNFFEKLAHGFNNAFSRQAANQTPQRGSEDRSSRMSCRCHLPEEMAWVLEIKFASDLEFPRDTEPEWRASLRVNTHDVPRLMREGFYWSEANVNQERGEYACYPHEENPSFQRFNRTYHLEDLEDDPQWVAELTVYSHELRVLSEFRIRNLKIEDTLSAVAYRPHDHWVYFYHVHAPWQCINAIYDDMPLKGWWPWPKELKAEDETEDEIENEVEEEAEEEAEDEAENEVEDEAQV